MPTLRISQLPLATAPLTGTEVVPVVQAGVTRQTAVSTLAPYINVKAYGAAGNGVADDTTAIQAAIVAAETAGQGAVYFPGGVYRTTAQLRIRRPVAILGSNAATGETGANARGSLILCQATTGNAAFLVEPDASAAIWGLIIRDLGINGNATADGIVLSVADLVYLIRIITGDAIPYGESGDGAKVNPYASALDVNAEMVDGNMVITTNSSSDLGAGHLVFQYTGLTVGAPTTNTGLDVKSNAANGELRVLVYSMQHNTVNAGVTQFVTIPVEGNGSIELVSAEFSDAAGNLMATTMFRVAPPTAFELMQNYPNPFNASTQIRFALPVASNWSLNIYNVAGQIVKSFEGSSEAGVVSVNWNADVASGIYFYKLTADNFTATKKMVLMK